MFLLQVPYHLNTINYHTHIEIHSIQYFKHALTVYSSSLYEGIGSSLLNWIILALFSIATLFRGSKLSRIRPKIIFMELIFVNFIIQPFCTIIIYNYFYEFYFRESQKIVKRTKVIGLNVSSYTVLFYAQNKLLH